MEKEIDLPLPEDWLTFRQAAKAMNAPNYNAMRIWVYIHKIPCKKFGKLNVVRKRDLVGYVPMGQRETSLV